MEVKDFFPVWNELSPADQQKLAGGAVRRTVEKGAVLHSGSLDCTGLLLV